MTREDFLKFVDKTAASVKATNADRDTLLCVLSDSACREALEHHVFSPSAEHAERLAAVLDAFDNDATRGRAAGTLFSKEA